MANDAPKAHKICVKLFRIFSFAPLPQAHKSHGSDECRRRKQLSEAAAQPFRRCRDLGGETFQKAFVNRAGSVYSERDSPRLIGSRGAIEWRIDALVP
jgi:hypothetical protein